MHNFYVQTLFDPSAVHFLRIDQLRDNFRPLELVQAGISAAIFALKSIKLSALCLLVEYRTMD